MSWTSTLPLLLLSLLSLAACHKESEVLSPPVAPIVYTTVRTLAGTGKMGYQDGPGAEAKFYSPDGIAVDGQGNVYVADVYNQSVRKITPAGVVSTWAGGPTQNTGFSPIDLALDKQNNLLVANASSNVLKVSPSGAVSTVAGSGRYNYAEGSATSAEFYSPNGIAVDAEGGIYLSDIYNIGSINGVPTTNTEARIRRITPAGTVSTLAGGAGGDADGKGPAAQFRGPEGLAIDASGTVYIAEFKGARIRKITPDGQVSTFAGTGVKGYLDGKGNVAQFNHPSGVAVDALGNVFVAEAGNHCIRKITPAGDVSTLAGTRMSGHRDGALTTAAFDEPSAIAIGKDGVLYIAEYHGNVIRTISAQ
jgi:sugar lactone lactonase YvrE